MGLLIAIVFIAILRILLTPNTSNSGYSSGGGGGYYHTSFIPVFGGYGYTKDYPVEKFYRDCKLCTIGEGTSEIQKVVISRNLYR